MTGSEWIAETYGLVKPAHLALCEAQAIVSCFRDRLIVENVDIREQIEKLAMETERVQGFVCLGMVGMAGERGKK